MIGLGLVLACLAQSPGRLAADTKLDLVVDPLRLVGRALHAWDATSGFGTLQNQAQGYLFPMGPLFAAAHGMGVPMWAWQRVWIGLLLACACAGTIRLSDELGIGTPATRVAAGLAYALSPALLVLVGPLSALVLPAALAPWALVPLVRGAAGGSPVGAAARAGVAIALMGAVNAGSTAAVLVLPALWLATRQRGPRRRALASWWALAVASACAWWVLSGLVELRYGFGFLSYIERASSTTSTASAPEVLRGTANWLAHYVSHGVPWWQGGWLLVAAPAAIFATAALAAAGLAGLAGPGLAERRFLAVSLLVGLALTAAAYGGPLGGPFSHGVQQWLDGPLSVFRSINKFQPVVALPLALGLGHGLSVMRPIGRERPLTAALTALLLAGAALPLLRGQVVPAGSFRQVPPYWYDAAGWLGANSGGSRSLLFPASGFGQYTWGRPIDEPLQPLAQAPWAVRDQAPLGSAGLTRLLDAVDGRLAAGRPTSGLAPTLARAGVRYLVARNDLDWRRAGAPSPGQVRDFLSAAPGIHRAAAFGPLQDGTTAGTAGGAPVRAIDVYLVDGDAPRAVTFDAAGTVVVSGGPEALLQLADRGQSGYATVVAGDRVGGLGADLRSAVTDGLRRRDDDFGLVQGGYSYVLAQGETIPGGGPPRDRLVVPGPAHQTVAVMEGAASVSASSYATAVAPHPESQPMSAFDDDPSTAWQTGAASGSDGQWVELALDHPMSFATLSVRLLDPEPGAPRPTSLRLTTDTGVMVVPVADTEQAQLLPLPPGPTRHVRVGLVGVVGEDVPGSLARAGLREVTLPGLQVKRPLSVPADEVTQFSHPGSPPPLFAFDRSVAAPGQLLRADEEDRLARRFTVPLAAGFELSGTLRAQPGPRLDALLQSLAPGPPPTDPRSSFSLPCGRGPVVSVDGRPIATSVTGVLADLRQGTELVFKACSGPVDLDAGLHQLDTEPQDALSVVSATLEGDGWARAGSDSASPARPLAVRSWSSNRRALDVAGGPRSVLALSENFSPGWSARLAGRKLAAVRVDGWRQGWVLPAASSARVDIEFTPDRPYRAALGAGAAALALLALLSTIRFRHGCELPPVGPGGQRVAIAGVATAALFVTGGPVAVIAFVGRACLRRPAALAAVAGGAMLAAGLVEAVHPARVPGGHGGAFGWAAQLAALVAAAAVAAAAVAGGHGRRRPSPARPVADTGPGQDDGGDAGPAGHQPVEPAGTARDVVVGRPGQGHLDEPVRLEQLSQGPGREQPEMAHDDVAGAAEDPHPADLGEDGLHTGQQQQTVEPGGQVRGRQQKDPA